MFWVKLQSLFKRGNYLCLQILNTQRELTKHDNVQAREVFVFTNTQRRELTKYDSCVFLGPPSLSINRHLVIVHES